MDASALLSRLACPLIPVVVIDRLDDAVPLAEALLQGGISALEITLRTPVACEAISAMKSARPDAVIGAGTVSSGEAYGAAVQAGADFVVSPGATDQLFQTAAAHAVPFLPGAVTGSEVLRAMEFGYAALKFFPAEAAGGNREAGLPRGFEPVGSHDRLGARAVRPLDLHLFHRSRGSRLMCCSKASARRSSRASR